MAPLVEISGRNDAPDGRKVQVVFDLVGRQFLLSAHVGQMQAEVELRKRRCRCPRESAHIRPKIGAPIQRFADPAALVRTRSQKALLHMTLDVASAYNREAI